MSLGNLPPTKSKFWKEADTNQFEVKKQEPCEHEFERKSGKEVVCKKCNIGYITTDTNIKVVDGKLEIRE